MNKELLQRLEKLREILDQDWKLPRDKYDYYNATDDVEILYMGLLDVISILIENFSDSHNFE